MRRRAEVIARERSAPGKEPENLSPDALGQAVHDLKVREIELELQEEELRAARAELEVWRARRLYLYDQAPAGYVTEGATGEIQECNLTFAALLGQEEATLAGRSLLHYIWTEDRRIHDLHREKLRETGDPQAYDLRMLRSDGTQFWARFVARLGRDRAGARVSHLAMLDITERKQAEETLRRSEKRFRDLTFTMADWVWEVDAEARFTFLSDSVFHTLGYTAAELIGRTRFELMPPAEAARLSRLFFEVLAPRREPFSDLLAVTLHKNGTPRSITCSGVPILDEQNNLVGYRGTGRDVTDRLAAEEALRKLSHAVEQSLTMVLITDARGNIEYVNAKFVEVTGYTMDEVRGKNPRILKSGEWTPAQYKNLWRTITSGREWRGEFHNKKKNGELFWESARIGPVRDAAGKITHFLALKEDITARKGAEAENQQYRALLDQARKMESVGRLAGGVAHDFNNMLQAILANLSLVLGGLPAGSPWRENIEETERCARRSAELTRQLLAFARKQPIMPRVIDLNATVEKSLRMLRRLIGGDIDLLWKPAAKLWEVNMDPGQIDQILVNLCLNARDASMDGGHVSIETGCISFAANEEFYATGHSGLAAGDFVLLSVSDDGRGMSPQVLAHVFEPFFTTKEFGQGTGLGLATVYGIVKQNQGSIRVDSKPGEGTTFDILLPRHTSPTPAPPPAEAPANVLPKGRETILLVEDEPAILRVTTQVLHSLGYQVLAAASPAEALSLAAEHAGLVDLLITDVLMPEMNGLELATELRSRDPKLRTMFMSGDTAHIIAADGVLEPGTHFLQKPFTLAALAEKVREALQGA